MAKKKSKKPPETYTLKKAKVKTVKRVLGIDPGKTNMGVSIIGSLPDDQLVVLANAMMTNPLSELSHNFRTNLEVFLSEIDRWVRLYKPDGIILERFMTRGTMGTTIEVVGIMIGAIAARYELPIKIISAATWKNEFRRRFTNINGIELAEYYKVAGITPHALDSVLIGCYGMEQGLQKHMKYKPKQIIRSAEKTSRTRLTNRKRTLEDL